MLDAAGALVFAALVLAGCGGGAPPETNTASAQDQTQVSDDALTADDLDVLSRGDGGAVSVDDAFRPRVAPPYAVRPDAVRIGVLLPLSGQAKGAGEAILAAVQLAIFDIGDPRLTLIPRDTGGTPEGAAAAAQAVLAEGAELILGPVFASSVAAVKPVANRYNVNVVAFSNDRTVAGDGVYLVGLMPEAQVDRIIGFARSRGLSRVAALLPDSPYGFIVMDALREAADRHGSEIVAVEFYPHDAGTGDDALVASVKRIADYENRQAALDEQRAELEARDDDLSKAALKRLEGLDTFGELEYDAILLADGGGRLRAVAPMLPFYDVDPARVQFLGTALWDDPTLGREPALLGAWFAAPPIERAKSFRERYEDVYGRAPPRIATLGYDATALAAVLARGAPATVEPAAAGGLDQRIFHAEAIEDENGFAGYDGIFRFGADGANQRGLAVIEITRNGLRTIDPGPTSFEALTN